MTHGDLRLVFCAAAFWLSTLSTLVLGLGPVLALAACMLGALYGSLLIQRHLGGHIIRYWAPTAALLLAAALSACLMTAAHLALERRGELLGVIERGGTAVIEGRIASYPLGKGSTVRMSVDRVRVGEKESQAHASVYLTGDVAGMGVGDIVRARVSLEGTSLGRELAWARIRTASRIRPASPVERWIAGREERLLENLVNVPQAALGLVPGLAIGDDSRLTEESLEAMKRVSLTHLTAVSGQHVSMVCALIVGLIGLRRRRLAVLGAAATLGLLVVGTAAQPSVLRAAVMGGAILASLWLRRPASALPALGLSIILLLAVDPRLACSYGFVLSVLATGGIVLGSGPATVLLAAGLPLPLANLLAVPLVAHLACAPVLALLSDGASLWSAAANALSAPVIPAATIASLGALLAAPVPLIGPMLAVIAGYLTTWVDIVARTLASWPGSHLAAEAVVAGYLGLFGACYLAARFRIPVLLTGAVGGLAFLASGARGPVEGWTIVQCDVGQGAASLVDDGERIYLVDTGMADARLPECLEHAGASVDVLVLTHLHADHAGRAQWVDEHYDLAEVWVAPGMSREARTLVDAPVIELRSGDHRGPFDILWPDGEAECFSDSCQNNQSLVLLAHLGQTYLITGDLEVEAQSALARRDVAADVALIAHHGSPRQDPAFAEAVGASLALLSVGPNTYGHPSPRTIELYERFGEVWSTWELGDIFLRLDMEY